MAHPAIMASISVTTISVVYAYILQIKKDRRADKLRDWVAEKYPDVYNDLPWGYRKMLRSEIGINIINKKKLIDDSDFDKMYKELKASDKRFYILLATGVLGIAFTIIASKYFGL